MAGKTLDDPKLTAKMVAEIVHTGEKMILPTDMSLDQAIDLLMRRKKYMDEDVVINQTFTVFPWDGAYALQRVLQTKYGWATAEPIPGFFGPRPPQMITIDIGPNEKINVPWGRFSLPNIEGFVQTGTEEKNRLVCFQLAASVKRRNEPEIRELFATVERFLAANSIYKGKAVKIRFTDDDGDDISLPTPTFLDTSHIDPNMLVYSQTVMDMIETNLFTPIKRVPDLIANKIPIKRGVLLGGTYGTGKTLAAHVASKHAVDNGITFIYVARADELARAIDFAKMYQSPASVIFCEDIDRTTNGERSVEMDDLLNIIDGIDTKNANIMVILTTNHLDNINQAMLRPGRLDAVIDVLPPDGPAVEKLIRNYAGKALDPKTSIVRVGAVLAGRIPAVIAEVVKRAKLAQLSLQPEGGLVTNLTEEALVIAANTMTVQLDLLEEKREPVTPALDRAFTSIVEAAVHRTAKQVDELRDHLLN